MNNTRIKDIPLVDRPRERLLLYGASNLSNEELLVYINNYLVLTNKLKYDSLNKINIEINILDIKSIYKPYWVGDFRGRNIFIDL